MFLVLLVLVKLLDTFFLFRRSLTRSTRMATGAVVMKAREEVLGGGRHCCLF